MPSRSSQVRYRLDGQGACLTGWVDLFDCTNPQVVYSDGALTTPVVGAVITPDGDCPQEVLLTPVPVTATGVDCAGAALSVTGVGVVQTVPHPTAVQLVKLCEPQRDYEKVLLCGPAGERVLAISDLTDPLAPTTTYWDMIAGAAWPGDPATLSVCPDADLESDPQPMCDGGAIAFTRWVVKKDGRPTGVYFDTDLTGALYAPVGVVTMGQCAVQRLHLNSVHWVGSPTPPAGFQAYTTALPDIPTLAGDPAVLDVSMLGVYAIDDAANGTGVYDIGTASTGPLTTVPLRWADVTQAQVDAILVAMGYPAGAAVLGVNPSGFPVVWQNPAVLPIGAFRFYFGTAGAAVNTYTAKEALDALDSSAVFPGSGCTEGKAWYDEATGALVRVTRLDGVDVTSSVLPADLREGPCPVLPVVRSAKVFYAQLAAGETLSMADIVAATGAVAVQSVQVGVASNDALANLLGDVGAIQLDQFTQSVSHSAISGGDAQDQLTPSAWTVEVVQGLIRVSAMYY